VDAYILILCVKRICITPVLLYAIYVNIVSRSSLVGIKCQGQAGVVE